MANKNLVRFRISNRNDSGFSLVELLIVLAIVVIAGILVLIECYIVEDKDAANKYFGISKVFSLSTEERQMLSPMVESRINEMKTKVDEAIVSVNRLKSRSD